MDGDVVFITQWGIYTFDATLEDGLEASVDLPSYVTESGVRINDHRIVQPLQLRVTGIVSSISFGMISSIFNNLTDLVYARPADHAGTTITDDVFIMEFNKWTENKVAHTNEY